MDKLKLIKSVVFILTFLLVFGSLAVMGTLFTKTHSSAPLPESITLNEPTGSTIRKLIVDDTLLYITVTDGGRPDRIIIFDTAKGHKVSTIHLNQR